MRIIPIMAYLDPIIPSPDPRYSASLRRFASVAFFAMALLAPGQGYAAKDPAVRYMQHVSKDLFAAARSGSTDEMMRAIRRHADVKTIGMFSLGAYAHRLPKSSRTSYFSGMTRFMARYFMAQHAYYKITDATIEPESFRQDGKTYVDSSVYLEGGRSYRVRWELLSRGKSFKVRDVQFLGFSLIALQGNLFRRYIEDHDYNVNALVIALSY